MKIELSADLKMPLDAVTQTFAFLARRGAGKTYGASKLAEEFLAASAQVVVLDPVGVWWGLRLDASGKGKGFDVPVFGGEHGDIPLEPTGGALVARAIVEHGTSVVLDVSHFRKNQRKQFCTDLAEELFHLKKKHRSPMHFFVEEAQVFVPQKTFHGDERMLGAFEDIIKLGRNYGIGATLISQRPQAVNKDVLNQTECLVVLQTNGAQERAALKAWMQEKDADLSMIDELPGLQRGEAFVWSPSWLQTFKRVQIGKKSTLDASATPEVGKERTERTLAPIDLGALEVAMKETVERAKADDPKALRAELARLRAEIAKAQKVAPLAPAKVETKRVEVPILKESEVKRLESAAGRMLEAAEGLEAHAEKLRAAADQVLGKMAVVVAPVPAPRPIAPARPVHAAPVRRQAPSEPPADGAFRRGAREMLVQLAKFDRLTRQQVATLAGMSPGSGTFSTYLGELKRAGYLVDERGDLAITDEGRAFIGPVDPAPATTEELVAMWSQRFRAGARAMLDVLVASYPEAMSRDDLAAAVQMSAASGTFSTYLGELQRNGLAEKRDGGIAASASLFMGVTA